MSEENIEKLQEELEEAKKQAAEYLDGWKRAKADFANREKDLVREKSDYLKFATSGMLLEIATIYETYEKALAEIEPTCGDVAHGLKQIKKQFEDFLKKKGMDRIETVGKKFDYNLHEAVGVEKSEDAKSGEIIKEIQAGYKFHGEVLRPAKVIVAE